MILAAHNAYLLEINTPPAVADPRRAGSGAVSQLQWEGQCQAYIQVQTVQSVREQSTLVELQTVLCTLPWNLPVYPAINDLCTFKMLEGTIYAGGQNVVLETRAIDNRFELAGYISLTMRLA